MKHDFRFSIFDFRLPGASFQNPKSKIQNPWLLLIVLIGIALRLWLIHVSPLDPRFSNADDGDYYRRALRFAVTGQYIDDAWLIRPPLARPAPCSRDGPPAGGGAAGKRS